MSPDDMLALAEHDEHMAEWCLDEAVGFGGVVEAAILSRVNERRESARYWREKARENG